VVAVIGSGDDFAQEGCSVPSTVVRLLVAFVAPSGSASRATGAHVDGIRHGVQIGVSGSVTRVLQSRHGSSGRGEPKASGRSNALCARVQRALSGTRGDKGLASDGSSVGDALTEDRVAGDRLDSQPLARGPSVGVILARAAGRVGARRTRSRLVIQIAVDNPSGVDVAFGVVNSGQRRNWSVPCTRASLV